MKTYRVQAYNTAQASENKIHDDAVARRLGFTGALVPGVDVYAYMMHLPVGRWGRAFLERGAAECRFANPVYDGEMAEVAGRDDADAIAIEVTCGGRSCATGRRACRRTPRSRQAGSFSASQPAGDGEPPRRESGDAARRCCPGLDPAGSERRFRRRLSWDVRETDDLYAREGLVHPGTVLRMCNHALLKNVLLGPWIHVGSVVQNFSAARVGETLVARARVRANYERKGHLFVELDVLVLGGASAAGRRSSAHRHLPAEASGGFLEMRWR